MPVNTPPPYNQPEKRNSDTVRPEWPALPANPPQPQGRAANVGGGRDPAVIRPTYPAPPANPAQPKGAVDNVNK
jgi:hypothetical protein